MKYDCDTSKVLFEEFRLICFKKRKKFEKDKKIAPERVIITLMVGYMDL